MYLDYSKIESRCVEPPVLRLQTLAGKTLGAIPYVYGLKFEINYSELSTIEFDVPYMVDEEVNPLYQDLTSLHLIYTDDLGIYVLMSPEYEGDGIKEIKHCRGYSIEKLFESKKLYLSEGTYDFWNPVHPADTVLGILLELDADWSPGYIDPDLIGTYRTFDEYGDNALNFLYSTAMEKYNCAVVFDVYNKTISAYHNSTDRGSLPIYLDYNNLVETVKVEELTDEMVTKLYPYGSDELDIRSVNPLGTKYLIDLSYFIANGDLDVIVSNGRVLSERYTEWQESVVSEQGGYSRLLALKASKTALRLAVEAELVDLQGELDSLTQQQSAQIYAVSMETAGTNAHKSALAILQGINDKIIAKNDEISVKNAEMDALQAEIDGYTAQVEAINSRVKFEVYFTEDEQRVLNRFFLEGDITDETFVATSVDAGYSPVSATVSGSVVVSGSVQTEIAPVTIGDATIYQYKGGVVSVESIGFSADVVSGVLEDSGGSYVLSMQLSTLTYNTNEYSGGLLTMTGTYTAFDGSVLFAENSKFYLTADAGEYQEQSVAQELYEYGAEVLNKSAWPVMEFTLDSANFLFLEEFAPFKEHLALGSGIHLSLGSEELITANVIGLSIDYESPDGLSLTFSNQYQRKNGVKTLRDMIVNSSMSGTSYDASKFTYNQSANKTTQVADFMDGNFEAAKNKVLCASNIPVSIEGSGIHVGNGNEQLRIIDSMIAMTSDNWNSVSVAVGKFNTSLGEHWGVNAELLAGSLIIGEKMVVENENNMFKLDESGAWLYNSQFLLQKDGGGQIMIHPEYGIAAGKAGLYATDGYNVSPSFIDEDGEIVMDGSTGCPQNASFYLDINTGDAYFSGKLNSVEGSIGGWTLAEEMLYGGSGSSYVGMSGSGSNAYAYWAGAENPASAKFWVKKDGTMYSNGGALVGCSIDVGNGNFTVDSNGNMTLNGNINLSGGSITWGSNYPASGISAAYAKTLITDALVSSPKVYGSRIMSLLPVSAANSTGTVEMYYGQLDPTNPDAYSGYLAGTIYLDSEGSGINEGQYRMFIKTNSVSGQPFGLKLESAGGTSIVSGGTIYMKASTTLNVHTGNGLSIYGNLAAASGTWDLSNVTVTGLNVVFG